MKHERKKLIGWKVLRIVVLVLTGIVLIGLIGFYITYKNLDGSIQGKKLDSKSKAELEKQAKENPYSKITGITNILLLGSDKRPGDINGHSDALFVATIDTVHNKLKLVSINRDSYVQNLRNGLENQKITNVTYLQGIAGLEYAIQGNFGLNISGYVQIDFEGLIGLVDDVGGIEIDMTEIYNNKSNLRELNAFINDTNNGIDTKADPITSPGVQKINGQQALGYSRIREEDTTYARIDRQQEVIMAILNKIENTNITKYPNILSTFSKYIQTDLPTSKLCGLAYAATKIKSNSSKNNDNEKVKKISGIEMVQTPFLELCMDADIYNAYHYNSLVEARTWNLCFDMEQNKKFLIDYIYKDVPFDPKKVDEDHLYDVIIDYQNGVI